MKRTIVPRYDQFSVSSLTTFGVSYRYSTYRGEISLLYPCPVTNNNFEIYCIKGDFFDDIERYGTLIEAEERITELLGDDCFKFGR